MHIGAMERAARGAVALWTAPVWLPTGAPGYLPGHCSAFVIGERRGQSYNRP